MGGAPDNQWRRGAGVDIDHEISKTQLALVFAQTPQAIAVTVLNSLVVFFILGPQLPSGVANLWLVMVAGIVAFRGTLYALFRRCPDLNAALRRWTVWSVVGAALGGLVWATAGWFMFVGNSLAYEAFLAFAIGGMVAGAVTTLSVYPPAVIIFTTLALLPLTVKFATATHVLGVPMAAMLALFMTMMLFASMRFFQNFRETLAESLRREAAEKELAQIAYYDPLTGLPNRRVFADHMKRATASASRHGTILAVCYLDIDDFKPFNDRYGHEAGDRVLVTMANTLEETLRGEDVVARWAGDEFALLLTGLADVDACEITVKRLVAAISQPRLLNGMPYQLHASIGAAIGEGSHQDPDTLLRQADQAMYFAKRRGRNGYHIFDAETDGEDRRSEEIRGEINRAIERDELVLHFQPKVELGTGAVYGAEALLRWNQADRGLVPPGAFLPGWEADPAMMTVDKWVLRTAVAHLARWIEDGLDIVLSVNVSTWLLSDPGFVDYLEELFRRYPHTCGKLEVEVTETRALDDISRITGLMSQCEDLMVSFALDDFGTGFSSLVHLQRLPAHTLKIDTSFVIAMLDNEHDRNLVRGIISLGQALGKSVVAEGVETTAHGEALLEFGCRLVQGYGIARPMPAEELAGWVDRFVAPPSWRESGRSAVIVRDVANG